MSTCEDLRARVQDGSLDAILTPLYTDLQQARARIHHVIDGLENTFKPDPGAQWGLFSSPGRTEIGGNHTDHQHGHVLCGSVDTDIMACAAKTAGTRVRLLSEGYPAMEIDVADLEPHESEYGSTGALIRGVAAGLQKQGITPGGVDIYAVSDVLSGSGLSSSAAFEVLLCRIFDTFYGNGDTDAVTCAQISQMAENVYFGKPCGLMDQLGAAVGGAVAIDLHDPATPVVEPIPFDFSRSGHALCIIDTGSCHADLTDEYAAITQEMGAIAACFDTAYLRDVSEEAFYARIPELRGKCGDRAVLRAMHFFSDDRLAQQEAQALKDEDFSRFLYYINQSGLSSMTQLQNIYAITKPQEQAMTLALAIARRALGDRGAVRVHGGGFAGTIQAFVPVDMLDHFCQSVDAVFGQGACHVMHIRPRGGLCLAC